MSKKYDALSLVLTLPQLTGEGAAVRGVSTVRPDRLNTEKTGLKGTDLQINLDLAVEMSWSVLQTCVTLVFRYAKDRRVSHSDFKLPYRTFKLP